MRKSQHGPTALYRFYNADGQLLYVGITQDIGRRWRQHRVQRPWWLEVAKKEYIWLDSPEEAKELERKALREEKPLYDRSGPLPPGQKRRYGSFYCHSDPLYEEAIQNGVSVLDRALRSGRFAPGTVLPSYPELSEMYRIPIMGVAWGLARLSDRGDQGVVQLSESRFLFLGDRSFPRDLIREYGSAYAFASWQFGEKPFTIYELASQSGVTPHTAKIQLKELCHAGLARQTTSQLVAGRWLSRYQLTGRPESAGAPPAGSSAE